MNNVKFHWAQSSERYLSDLHTLTINGIPIASVNINLFMNRDKPEPGKTYHGYINLPRLQNRQLYNASDEALKKEIEQLVNAWFDKVLSPVEQKAEEGK